MPAFLPSSLRRVVLVAALVLLGGGATPAGAAVDPLQVTAVGAGANHACAVRANGTLACWGRNSYGAIGDGTTDLRPTPVVVSGLTDVVGVDGGSHHTCVVRSGGAVSCWGANFQGQIGDGSTIHRSRPTPVNGIADAIAVTAGDESSCVLHATGEVSCWGSNLGGQLGDGTTTNRDRPFAIPGIVDAVAIASSGLRTCALRATGGIICWGENGNGQLGDGTTTDRFTPGPVLGLTDATAIAVGYNHTCALRADHSVSCWGSDADGQLGNAAAVTRSTTPVAVDGITNATQITTLNSHTCALLSDGTITCWGKNADGQIGDRTRVVAPTPVTGTGISNASAITAGGYATYALRPHGIVSAWGTDTNGELGIGFLGPSQLAPVRALTDQIAPTTTNDVTTRYVAPGRRVTLTAIDTGGTDLKETTYEIVSAGGTPGPTTTYDPANKPVLGDRERIRYRSSDYSGNTETDQTSVPSQVDGVAPTAGTDDLPASGFAAAPFAITLTAGTDVGSGVDRIDFQLLSVTGVRGPVQTYDPASKPVIGNLGRIVYWTVDKVGNKSPERTTAFLIVDATAPTTTASPIPATWQPAPVTVTLTVTPDGVGQSGLDRTTYEIVSATGTPGSTQTYSAANKPELGNGERLRYRSIDLAGNVEADHTTPAAQVDPVAPTTTDNVLAGWTLGPNFTVTLTASDAGGSGLATTTYEIVSASGTPGATQTYSSASKPVLQHGQKIRYRSTDAAGNAEADNTSVAAQLDSAEPVTTEDVPAGWSKTPVTVTLAAADTESGVSATFFFVIAADGTVGPRKTYGPAVKPVLQHGEKVRYFSLDSVGNREADQTSAAAKVDGTPPTTADDVPAGPQAGPVRVTLTASDDAAGSGVDTTTYEIIGANGTPGATKAYDPASKPLLAAGEKLRYRSVDVAGNAESDRTSGALSVVVPTPTPTATVVPTPIPTAAPTPAPTPTPAPGPVVLTEKPIITATFGADGKGRQVLLAKEWVTIKVGCSAAPCRVTIRGRFYVKGERIATLKPYTATIAAGERPLLRIPTTLNQRRLIRRAVGNRGTRSEARFKITATTLTTPSLTIVKNVTVGLRQVTTQR